MKQKSSRASLSVENRTGDQHIFMEFVDRAKWNLIPFFVSLALYCFLCVPMEKQTMFGMVLKCLPIVALQIFTLQNGISWSGQEHSFERKIFFALVFSSIGDAFLDFPGYFMYGTIAFAVAQILNISAFGFTPLKIKLGLKVLGLLSLPLLLIAPRLTQEETKLLIAVTMYAPLLKIMIWRAVARLTFETDDLDWPKLFCAAGAISFGISDATLALNKYWTPIPYAQAIIMTTYYLAQFGIALSVVGVGPKRRR